MVVTMAVAVMMLVMLLIVLRLIFQEGLHPKPPNPMPISYTLNA